MGTRSTTKIYDKGQLKLRGWLKMFIVIDNEGEGVIAQVKTKKQAIEIATINEKRTKRNTTVAKEIR